MSTATPMEELKARLEARRQVQVASSGEKEAWIQDIAGLCATVREWCRPLEEQGLLEVKPGRLEVHEPALGTYTADQLAFCLPGSAYHAALEPRGLRMTGVRTDDRNAIQGMTGRVDFGSYTGDVIPVFRDKHGKWCMVGRLPGLDGEFHPFDEQTFAVALDWLLP